MSAVSDARATEHETGTVAVEVRVWQDIEDPRTIHVGARSAAGSWRTLGMVPLALDDGVTRSGYRYGGITLDVAIPDWEPPIPIEVRVWQHPLPEIIYISARPAGGSWLTLGTVRLFLEDGIAADGQRFGDVRLDVPLPAAAVTTLAGQPGVRGYADGAAGEALFGRYFDSLEMGLAVDRDGSVVVADPRNRAIRRILPDGTVTTIAGGNGRGVRDGPRDTAQFADPEDVAIAPDGSIYVVDSRGHRLRKVAPDGSVTTLVGSGPIDGRGASVDGPVAEAMLASPKAIAIDDFGDIYVVEYQGRIRRISPSGWVSTYAGAAGPGYRDGPASRAQFRNLLAVDVDADGNLYVVDSWDGGPLAIRKIDTRGMVETLYRDPHAGRGGTLAHALGLAVSDRGVIYIANTGRHQIVRLTGAGNLRAVAGTGQPGYTNGALDRATFNLPGAIALTGDGALVVADEGNNVIRRVPLDRAGLGPRDLAVAVPREIPRVEGVQVEVFAGSRGPSIASASRLVDGPARVAQFDRPWGMALDPDGNVIVADSWNHAIRRVAPDGRVTTVAGGGVEGVRDGSCERARFAEPEGVAVDDAGFIYVADAASHRIRRISPDCVVTTVAGGASATGEDWSETFGHRDGPAEQALFREPNALVFDREGNLLILDRGNSRIRMLSHDGMVSTIAGGSPLPREGYSQGNHGHRDGYGQQAFFFLAGGMAIDREGSIFFTEYGGVRVIDDDGYVSTVLRTTHVRLGSELSLFTRGIAVGADGALYVADPYYNRVVRVTRDGMLAIVADELTSPTQVLALPDGALLISDSRDNVIRKITFGAGQ